MKKPTIAWLSLLLAVILLTGCVNLNGLARMAQQALGRLDSVKYEDMVYSRPDPAAVEQALAEACQAAAGTDVEQILEKVYAFYDAYDSFYTNYSLADLHYSGDLTDTYWEAEYGNCVANSAAVDAALEKLYYALAASPCRDALESDDYFGPGFLRAMTERTSGTMNTPPCWSRRRHWKTGITHWPRRHRQAAEISTKMAGMR